MTKKKKPEEAPLTLSPKPWRLGQRSQAERRRTEGVPVQMPDRDPWDGAVLIVRPSDSAEAAVTMAELRARLIEEHGLSPRGQEYLRLAEREAKAKYKGKNGKITDTGRRWLLEQQEQAHRAFGLAEGHEADLTKLFTLSRFVGLASPWVDENGVEHPSLDDAALLQEQLYPLMRGQALTDMATAVRRVREAKSDEISNVPFGSGLPLESEAALVN